YELPKRTEIETAARQFYELLNTPNRIYARADQKQAAILDTQQRETLEAVSHLSQILLGPVAAQLGQKRLVIVADGALQYLPFGALLDPTTIKQSNVQPMVV